MVAAWPTLAALQLNLGGQVSAQLLEIIAARCPELTTLTIPITYDIENSNPPTIEHLNLVSLTILEQYGPEDIFTIALRQFCTQLFPRARILGLPVPDKS